MHLQDKVHLQILVIACSEYAPQINWERKEGYFIIFIFWNSKGKAIYKKVLILHLKMLRIGIGIISNI